MHTSNTVIHYIKICIFIITSTAFVSVLIVCTFIISQRNRQLTFLDKLFYIIGLNDSYIFETKFKERDFNLEGLVS